MSKAEKVPTVAMLSYKSKYERESDPLLPSIAGYAIPARLLVACIRFPLYIVVLIAVHVKK